MEGRWSPPTRTGRKGGTTSRAYREGLRSAWGRLSFHTGQSSNCSVENPLLRRNGSCRPTRGAEHVSENLSVNSSLPAYEWGLNDHARALQCYRRQVQCSDGGQSSDLWKVLSYLFCHLIRNTRTLAEGEGVPPLIILILKPFWFQNGFDKEFAYVSWERIYDVLTEKLGHSEEDPAVAWTRTLIAWKRRASGTHEVRALGDVRRRWLEYELKRAH